MRRVRASLAALLLAAAPCAAQLYPGSFVEFGRFYGSAMSAAYPIPAQDLVFWHRTSTTLSTNSYFGAYPATLSQLYVGTNGFACTNTALNYASLPPISRASATPVTFAAWVWPNGSGAHYVFGNAHAAEQGFHLMLYAGNKSIQWYRTTPTAYFGRVKLAAFTNGGWFHLAVTWDGTTITNYAAYKIYKNCVRIDDANMSYGSAFSWAASTNRFLLGNYDEGSSYGFFGYIDEAVYYDRVLTDLELTNLFTATRGLK